ncbi:MAG: bifunctional riboflavin kinase/FAD synthetase [Erysipelotrichaceae bacterium]|nr:bifunctional riboflavin kinase/FAD synthetase [Erysipelotrichaceae bacterium]
MKIIHLDGYQWNINEPIVSAIGYFDGLHVGHMELVKEVLSVSKRKGYKSALMTFDHQPSYILGYSKEEKYLSSMLDRKNILEQMGIDYLLIIDFSKEVARLSPGTFIEKYIINSHIKHIVCGFDFRFGYQNQGDAYDIQNYQGIDVTIIDEVIYDNEKISSSRIRQYLDLGRISYVTELLGRRYTITGKVIKGRQIGRTIGFKTANIEYNNYYLPQRGVYVVKAYIHDQVYMGMCNIGLNPTFSELSHMSLEVNILDFDEDIYGEYVKVEFYAKMRGEKTFDNRDGLIKQLTSDQQYTRKYFAENID